MYHYNFTNDLRITSLDEILKEASNAFLTNTVPSATEDKSKNNNFMTVGFYFNLKAKGNCAKLAAKGNTKKVVLNFIKKFQFPNPRTSADFENSVNDKILLAPMRDIVKILHILSLNNGTIAYLTKEEIKNFIFYNNDLAKRKNYNLLITASQIIQYRKDSRLPQNIDTTESEHFWNQPDRQIREMIKTLNYTGCFLEDENGIRLKTDGITRDNEADLFEIINCNSYWKGETAEEYQKYMDNISMPEDDMEKTVDKATSSSKAPNKFIPSQTILYGVPGSGKSYTIKNLLAQNNISSENTMRVVFHPEYTNSDFIGQILPKLKKDTNGENVIDYQFTAGPFAQILRKAYCNPDTNFALIIEEINRGNAAAIFGELFQLLDRLDEDDTESFNGVTYTKGWSSYGVHNDCINAYFSGLYDEESPEKKVPAIHFDTHSAIRLPANLSLFATMNTSDQNVFSLDNAFKRRWGLRLIPNKFVFDSDDTKENKKQFDQCFAEVEGFDFIWGAFVNAINSKIVGEQSGDDISSFEDKQIGMWFVKATSKEGADGKIISKETFMHKVIEYLFDDVFKLDSSILFTKTSLAELIEVADGDSPRSIFANGIVNEIEAKQAELKESKGKAKLG